MPVGAWRDAEDPGPGNHPGCVLPYLEWDASTAVRQAVAAGASSMTLALRTSEEWQGDVGYGRRYANNLSISIAYNLPPATPTDLSIDVRPCAGELNYVPLPVQRPAGRDRAGRAGRASHRDVHAGGGRLDGCDGVRQDRRWDHLGPGVLRVLLQSVAHQSSGGSG